MVSVYPGRLWSNRFTSTATTAISYTDHFGSPTGTHRKRVDAQRHGWTGALHEARREFPDLGRATSAASPSAIRH